MCDTAVPEPIARLFAWPALDAFARLALPSPFLVSGIAQLLGFFMLQWWRYRN